MLIGLTKEELPVINVVWLYHTETCDIYGKNVGWFVATACVRGDGVLLMMCLLGCCGP